MDAKMGLSDLQQQVLEDLGMQISKSMDFEILCVAMIECGWHVFTMDYDPESGPAWNTIVNWADENFEGDFQEHKGTWLIENAKDATMFALKWKCR